MTNIEQSAKRQVEESTLREDSPSLREPITNSTRILSQYFQPPKMAEEEQTVKKRAVRMIESEEEDDLLISVSVRPPSPPHKLIPNPDHSIERMLLMQALFIEHFLDATPR